MSEVDSACVPYIASGEGEVFPIDSDGTRSRRVRIQIGKNNYGDTGNPYYFPGMGNIPGGENTGPWPPPYRPNR